MSGVHEEVSSSLPGENRFDRIEVTAMRWVALFAALVCGVFAVQTLVANPASPDLVENSIVTEWCRDESLQPAVTRSDPSTASTDAPPAMSPELARKVTQVALVDPRKTPQTIAQALVTLGLGEKIKNKEKDTKRIEDALSSLLDTDESRRGALHEYVKHSEQVFRDHTDTTQQLHEAKIELEHARLDREVGCVKALAEIRTNTERFTHKRRLELAAAFFGLTFQALAVLFLLQRGSLAQRLKYPKQKAVAVQAMRLTRELGPGVVLAALGAWMLALALLDDPPDMPLVSTTSDRSATPVTGLDPE